MQTFHFEDPREFQKAILHTLVQHEAENNLILGILANLIAGEYSENRPYLAVFQDSGQVQAVSLCTPPWPVLVSYENPPPGKRILKAMLAHMREKLGDDFTGLTGNKAFISRLVSLWEEDSEKKALIKMANRIYKLEEVQPVSGVPGRMRPVEDSDRELLEDWYAGFQRDAIHEEPDLERVQKQVNTCLAANPLLRGMMVWEVEGQPVSMAGYAGPTPNGIRVGPVYTPPDLRRKGYASAVTASLSQHLLDQGFKFCFLFADLLNPTSNHIYQQIGFRAVCDTDRYLFV
jgi:predicted GNAT family acetyltransferase